MARSHKFQAPKGTRDFYPEDLAIRRHIESAWRTVSIAHGFDEIEGPMFEHLDLYTVKSGPGIVSELFSFRRAGGDTDYALRPEFTPTLARMVAARAAQLPKPTRWFCIPNHFRAERPQRGRLREFIQWNADIIGDDSPRADAEIIALTIGVLERLGLKPADITIKLSHRVIVTDALRSIGIDDEQHEALMQLLDRREKLEADAFAKQSQELGYDDGRFTSAIGDVQQFINDAILAREQGREHVAKAPSEALAQTIGLIEALHELGVLKWCEFDASIVRGLAYYTGTVFEVHESTGRERAIAGGGRYDGLVELFGGPPTPAVGIAMGDVVIRLVLEDQALIERPEAYLPRPDVFLISAGKDEAEAMFRPLLQQLRSAGLHVRHSDRATRNVGKLLGEAGKTRARLAIILGDELDDGQVGLKNLDTGEQRAVPIDAIEATLRSELN